MHPTLKSCGARSIQNRSRSIIGTKKKAVFTTRAIIICGIARPRLTWMCVLAGGFRSPKSDCSDWSRLPDENNCSVPSLTTCELVEFFRRTETTPRLSGSCGLCHDQLAADPDCDPGLALFRNSPLGR